MAVMVWETCMPPPPRPLYAETFAVYGPNPDCLNKDRHIRYLTRLKDRDVQSGDNIVAYNHAIDLYIERLEHYCQ